MIKQLFFSSILMLSLCTTATAQDLHVYYDVFRDSVWFVKGGMSTETPGVHKRDMVQLHVVEYNNYLYNLKTEQKELSEETGKTGLETFFSDSEGKTLDGFLQSLPIGNIGVGLSKLLISDLLGYATDEKRDSSSRGDLDLTFESAVAYTTLLSDMTEEMYSLSVQIGNLSKRISAGSLSVGYIDNLVKT